LANDRFWHIADVPLARKYVCFEGKNRHGTDSGDQQGKDAGHHVERVANATGECPLSTTAKSSPDAPARCLGDDEA
jgi:hypothetical protein